MTLPLFLFDPLPGDATFRLDGAEGRHAAVVRRIGPGEEVLVGDGRGHGVRARVLSADKAGLSLEVMERLSSPEPAVHYVVVQALAKGDRSELALEVLTEVGAAEILPWQSQRSIVRWSGDRGDKALAKWRATVREAAKQSRRLRVPEVGQLRRDLAPDVRAAELALVLHEEATTPLREVTLPKSGTVLIIVGPEGGIAPDELAALVDAGATAVSMGEGVLRTSTAGAVALAGLVLR